MDARTITAICAAVIALAALVTSIWQGIQNRKHNRLSVRPRMRVDYSTYADSPIKISVSNNGTGPAIIRGFSVSVDGNKVQSDDLPLAAAAAKRAGIDGPHDSYTPTIGDTFAKDESKDLLLIRNSPVELEKRRELRRQLRRIGFDIEYESIYGDLFSTSRNP